MACCQTKVVFDSTCTTQNCANNGCNVIPKFYYLNSNACNPQNGEELVITTAFGQSYPDCASPVCFVAIGEARLDADERALRAATVPQLVFQCQVQM